MLCFINNDMLSQAINKPYWVCKSRRPRRDMLKIDIIIIGEKVL